MNSIDVLSLESQYTMEQLRLQREVLMTQRMELIERHRKLSNRTLIKPFLQTAQPPTPLPPESLQSFDSSWIKNFLVGLVYDAVREVDIVRPYREKLNYYTVISQDYETLVERVVSKSIKQSVVTEMFENLWNELALKEVKLIVKQCIGDLDISGSLASSLILQSIICVNEKNNATPNVFIEMEICKNLMSEICLERNKRKNERFFHKLHLKSIIERTVDGEPVSQQDRELTFEGQVLTALRTFDIQCLESFYQPIEFEQYSATEVWLWRHITGEVIDLNESHAINAFSLSNSLKYAAMATKNHITVIRCEDNFLIGKKFIDNTSGDCVHISWLENEQEIVVTTSIGKVLRLQFFGPKLRKTSTAARKSTWQTRTTQTSSDNRNVIKFKSSFTGIDLRLSDGSFAQPNTDTTVRHVPVQVYPAPIYTVCGEQPVFLVVCDNNEILRVCYQIEEPVLLPDDIPQFHDIANTADSGAKVDICKGHRAKVIQVCFKDEYTFYSFDESCVVIEWEYSKDCFDAYGYVLPKKYLVQGNDLDYVRLLKGLVSHYNVKNSKTRQEVLQAAKAAEQEFNKIGYGKKPISTRVNTERGLVEKTFVRTVNLGYELEVRGTVVVNKVLGRALVAMKSQMFKLKNCPPSQLLGISHSPCGSLIAYCFAFWRPLYGVQPYLSILLLNSRNMSFLNNKIKIPLSFEQAEVLEDAPDKFSFCLSPPHYITKSAYLFIRIDKSVLIVSTATSNVVRTTLDMSNLSTDSSNFLSEKKAVCLQGARLSCTVWGQHLLVFGNTSKNVLAFSLRAPKGEEFRELFFRRYHKCHFLADLVDPERKRLLMRSQVCWGRLSETPHEHEKLSGFIKHLLSSKIFDKLAGLSSENVTTE